MTFVLIVTLFLRVDGGMPVPADSEVVKNLELLELMDETTDYELLEELSVER